MAHAWNRQRWIMALEGRTRSSKGGTATFPQVHQTPSVMIWSSSQGNMPSCTGEKTPSLPPGDWCIPMSNPLKLMTIYPQRRRYWHWCNGYDLKRKDGTQTFVWSILRNGSGRRIQLRGLPPPPPQSGPVEEASGDHSVHVAKRRDTRETRVENPSIYPKVEHGLPGHWPIGIDP